MSNIQSTLLVLLELCAQIKPELLARTQANPFVNQFVAASVRAVYEPFRMVSSLCPNPEATGNDG